MILAVEVRVVEDRFVEVGEATLVFGILRLLSMVRRFSKCPAHQILRFGSSGESGQGLDGEASRGTAVKVSKGNRRQRKVT